MPSFSGQESEIDEWLNRWIQDILDIAEENLNYEAEWMNRANRGNDELNSANDKEKRTTKR